MAISLILSGGIPHEHLQIHLRQCVSRRQLPESDIFVEDPTAEWQKCGHNPLEGYFQEADSKLFVPQSLGRHLNWVSKSYPETNNSKVQLTENVLI